MRTIVPAAGAASAALAVLAFALPANAALLIAGDVGGTTFFCADNDVSCDQSALVGTLQLANQTINGVAVNGSISTSSKAAGSDILNTSSLSVINTSATSKAITITVGDTDFVGPVDTFATSGSGTWQDAQGSNVTLNWFNDPANSQGAQFAGDVPGSGIDTFTSNALARADSFAHSNTAAIVDGALFSMTEQATGTLVAGAQLLSRGQTEIKTAAAVPEPGSLALLGAALVAFVAIRRQRAAA